MTKINPKDLIGRRYQEELDKLTTFYQLGLYEIEKTLYDSKGMSFRCYSCLKQIKEPHPYFYYQEKNLTSKFRFHESCIKKLANIKEFFDTLKLIANSYEKRVYKKEETAGLFGCWLCGHADYELNKATSIEEYHFNKRKAIIPRTVYFHEECALIWSYLIDKVKIAASGNFENDLERFQSNFRTTKERVRLEAFIEASKN